MTNIVRRSAGTPLSEEAKDELRMLAEMPDDEIDLSDIPERLAEHQKLPLEPHTVTLRVDAEVAAWLEGAGERYAERINSLLRREARRSEANRASALGQAS